jgi:ubiquinone biosynthesis protein UbiJ
LEPALIDLAFLHAFNHLLGDAPWARARLAPFAGRRAPLLLGPLEIDFRIAQDGSVESLGTGEPAIEIALPLPAPLAVLEGREALLRGARVSGAADFAEALGFVLRHLDWDAEEALSGLVGDIAARGIVRAASGFLAARADTARRLAENIDEYLRYERKAL